MARLVASHAYSDYIAITEAGHVFFVGSFPYEDEALDAAIGIVDTKHYDSHVVVYTRKDAQMLQQAISRVLNNGGSASY